jgi:hypothetical protein
VLAGVGSEVEYRDMNRSSSGRLIVVITVATAALLGAFLLGRASAPDASAAAGPSCSTSPRFQIAVPSQFLNAQGAAYFSQCEQQAAMGKVLGQPGTRVKIYDSQSGSKVLAWWYPDCGMPEGVYAVGTPHPARCVSVATTASAAAP